MRVGKKEVEISDEIGARREPSWVYDSRRLDMPFPKPLSCGIRADWHSET